MVTQLQHGRRNLLLVVFIVLVLGLAAGFLPAVASDGCGGSQVISAGCEAIGVVASCIGLVALALGALIRPPSAARAAPARVATPLARQHGPPVEAPTPIGPTPLRL